MSEGPVHEKEVREREAAQERGCSFADALVEYLLKGDGLDRDYCNPAEWEPPLSPGLRRFNVFAQDCARKIGVPKHTVERVLANDMGDESGDLLDFPFGWTILANAVGLHLGLWNDASPDILPDTIH